VAGGPPALRAAQEGLSAATLGQPDRVGGVAVAATIANASDRITDSLDTLLEEVRRQHAEPLH
jgi:hypothetical protein